MNACAAIEDCPRLGWRKVAGTFMCSFHARRAQLSTRVFRTNATGLAGSTSSERASEARRDTL